MIAPTHEVSFSVGAKTYTIQDTEPNKPTANHRYVVAVWTNKHNPRKCRLVCAEDSIYAPGKLSALKLFLIKNYNQKENL